MFNGYHIPQSCSSLTFVAFITGVLTPIEPTYAVLEPKDNNTGPVVSDYPPLASIKQGSNSCNIHICICVVVYFVSLSTVVLH